MLLVEDVTLKECSILTGYASDDLEELIHQCAPMLFISFETQHVEFANAHVRDFLLSKWDLLLASPMSRPSSKEVSRQIILQHGYLAWRCFNYIDETYASMPALDADIRTTAAVPGLGVGSLPVDQDSSVQLASSTSSNTVGIYPVQYWRQHVVAGGEPVAQSLFADLPQFWSFDAPLRSQWLHDCAKHRDEFVNLDNVESMSALHVASALGLWDLATVLLKSSRDALIHSLDGNQYTPVSTYNQRMLCQFIEYLSASSSSHQQPR